MKPFILLLSLALIAAGCGTTTGCKSVQSVAVEGGYTQATGQFSVGIVITFKVHAPTDPVVSLLASAGAVRVKTGPEVWVLPFYNRLDQKQGAAIEASLLQGAVLSKYPQPK